MTRFALLHKKDCLLAVSLVDFVFVDMEDPSQLASLLQRLFTRLDHIEFSLVKQNQEDFVSLRDTVGKYRRRVSCKQMRGQSQ